MELSKTDVFGTYHPSLCFLFFIAAIVFGMCFRQPLFLAVGVFFSAVYYLSIRRRAGIKLVLAMIPVFLFIAFINPFISESGTTVLFTFFHGARTYTLEALFHGMATASMLVTMILWFASYNQVVTTDKFVYLFGRFAPAVTMVIAMVLRFVPNYRRHLQAISGARACISKAGSKGDSLSAKVQNGAVLLSSLITWAFENGVTTADSMKSRGYGLSGRTAFSIYHFDSRDGIVLATMLAFCLGTLVTGIMGAGSMQYVPNYSIPPMTLTVWTGLVSYALFLALPTLLNIRESLIWRISLSRI